MGTEYRAFYHLKKVCEKLEKMSGVCLVVLFSEDIGVMFVHIALSLLVPTNAIFSSASQSPYDAIQGRR